jgi:hypothetical protein
LRRIAPLSVQPSDSRRSRAAPPEARCVSAISEELGRLFTFEERHRRLLARLTLVVATTLAIDVCGTIAIYLLERNSHGTDVRTLGQAFFFTTVQLLTVSSQIKNPVTPVGRVVDILLELWAVIVVAGSAGAIAAFFQNGDSG